MTVTFVRHKAVDRLPKIEGLYLLYDADDDVVYVGSSSNVHSRLSQHSDKDWVYSQIIEVNGLSIEPRGQHENQGYNVGDIELLQLEAALVLLFRPKYNLSPPTIIDNKTAYRLCVNLGFDPPIEWYS